MSILSAIKMRLGKAVLQNDSSFSITIDFENVIGTAQVVDLYNKAADLKKEFNGWNGVAFAQALISWGTVLYGCIKSGKNAKQ